MATDGAHRTAALRRPRAAAGERPTAAIVLFASVGLGAAASTVWAATAAPVTARDLALCGLLLALEIGYVEVLRWTRPRPDRRAPARRRSLGAVVVVAGALLLPPVAAVVLPVVAIPYERRRLELPGGRPHPVAFGVAATVLACLAVWLVRHWAAGGAPAVAAGLGLVLLAMAVFTLVEGGLAAAAVALTETRPSLRRLLGGLDDNLLDLAAVALGGLAAAAVASTPWLAPMVLPAMIVMHRAMVVPQLTEDSRVDGKTGLLNSATWHERAAADLAGTRPDHAPRAVLMIDVDHFKSVNDTYGHVAGDVVLAAVADAVRGAVRSQDLVGRFGGEEFVVLLAPSDGGGAAEVNLVAHRIRRTVAALTVVVDVAERPRRVGGLRVSIGAGVQRAGGHPAGRGDLGELVRLADEAVYAAKRAGRDQVRVTALTSRS